MLIRTGQTKDRIPLTHFARETFLAAYGGDHPPETVRQHMDESLTDDVFGRELSDPNITFLLATENDEHDSPQLLGYGKMRWHRPIAELDGAPAAQLERIYVDQKRHSRGVGTALISDAVERATENQAEWLWLSVWEENRRAHRFYERNGFSRVGKTTFMMGSIREEDIIYAIRLSAQR